MIKSLLFFIIIGSSQVLAQEIGLEYFSLPQNEIQSEGSIVYYSDSLSNIELDKFLVIEGWSYDIDNREYKYFCFVKIGDTVHKLESVSRLQDESKTESVFKNDLLTLSIETSYLKEIGYESYYEKGTLTISSGDVEKIINIFGLVAV